MLSKSVADSFKTVRQLNPENDFWKQTIEKEKFCRMFDKFYLLFSPRGRGTQNGLLTLVCWGLC